MTLILLYLPFIITALLRDLVSVQVYCFEIVLGLKHLHDNGVVFRDLKPSNILVSDNGHLKLCDLGLAAPLYVNETIKQPPKDDEKLIGDEGEIEILLESGGELTGSKKTATGRQTKKEADEFYKNLDMATQKAFEAAQKADPNLVLLPSMAR